MKRIKLLPSSWNFKQFHVRYVRFFGNNNKITGSQRDYCLRFCKANTIMVVIYKLVA